MIIFLIFHLTIDFYFINIYCVCITDTGNNINDVIDLHENANKNDFNGDKLQFTISFPAKYDINGI